MLLMAKAKNSLFIAIIMLTSAALAQAQQSSSNQIVGSPATPQMKAEGPQATPAQPVEAAPIILPANAVLPPAPFVIKKSANTVVIPGSAANMIGNVQLADSNLDDEEAAPSKTNKIVIPTDANKSLATNQPEAKFEERPVIASSVKIGSSFGYRVDPFTGGARFHSGVDIKAAWGDPVGASQTGIVKFAGWHSGYGNLVIVDHGGGVTTHYAHLSGFTVAVGTKVGRGTIVGRAGSTGRSTSPHLHYEVRIDDNPVNPLRPLALDETSDYFKFNPAQAQPAQPKVLSTTDSNGPSTKLQQHNN
jgi:murein DD-endopeptidase MepM/ murein hydrolase activator NlpD